MGKTRKILNLLTIISVRRVADVRETSADFRLDLQSNYDKETAELALAKEIRAIEPMRAAQPTTSFPWGVSLLQARPANSQR